MSGCKILGIILILLAIIIALYLIWESFRASPSRDYLVNVNEADPNLKEGFYPYHWGGHHRPYYYRPWYRRWWGGYHNRYPYYPYY